MSITYECVTFLLFFTILKLSDDILGQDYIYYYDTCKNIFIICEKFPLLFEKCNIYFHSFNLQFIL